MEEKRRISCIVCPLSCEGEVSSKSGIVNAVTGFSCPRGEAYAREEVTAPKRMLTTTVRINGGKLPLLPVVSQQALPKDKIIPCARCLANLTIIAPIKEGEVVVANILNLGVDIIASRDINPV
ncbi:MAG: hypothetical protein H6Q74_1121 [Firmicutes bacterium]|nr:hypothetical protein [Bacillota bacterium]